MVMMQPMTLRGVILLLNKQTERMTITIQSGNSRGYGQIPTYLFHIASDSDVDGIGNLGGFEVGDVQEESTETVENQKNDVHLGSARRSKRDTKKSVLVEPISEEFGFEKSSDGEDLDHGKTAVLLMDQTLWQTTIRTQGVERDPTSHQRKGTSW